MDLQIDPLTHPAVIALLHHHVADLAKHSPPESCHALDLTALRQPGITFWTAWEGPDLLGCGAIKELDATHAELKSMRTAPKHLRKGVARAILVHILAEAKQCGYQRISLETGPHAPFAPAQTMYRAFGFSDCPPFGDYVEDPYSMFLSKVL